MKKYIKSFENSLFAVAIVLVLLISGHSSTTNIAKADLGGNVNILNPSMMKFGTTSVSSSATSLVLATSSGRTYAVISNTGSTAVYLYFYPGTTSLPFYANQPTNASSSAIASSCGATTCPVANTQAPGGMILNAASNFTIGNDNLYQGAVWAIGASSSADVVSVTANQ